MAIECAFVLSGSSSPAEIFARALPAGERALVEHSGLDDSAGRIVDLRESKGFLLSFRKGTDGYFEAEEQGRLWIWKPEEYFSVGFRLDKDFPRQVAWTDVLQIVERLLSTGREDAAMILNGDVLLLRREAGVVTRYNATGFWRSADATSAS